MSKAELNTQMHAAEESQVSEEWVRLSFSVIIFVVIISQTDEKFCSNVWKSSTFTRILW